MRRFLWAICVVSLIASCSSNAQEPKSESSSMSTIGPPGNDAAVGVEATTETESVSASTDSVEGEGDSVVPTNTDSVEGEGDSVVPTNLDAALDKAISDMNLPDNSAVSVTVIDLNTGEEVELNGYEPRFASGTALLPWAIAGARQGDVDNALIQSALLSTDGSMDAVIKANTAGNDILDKLSGNETGVCDRRRAEITKATESFLPDALLSRRLYPYHDEGLKISPQGCDVDTPSNEINVVSLARLFKELAEGGGSLGLNVDQTQLILSSMQRNQYIENSQPYGNTRTFMGQWMPEYITPFSIVGSTDDKGRIEGALFLYHPQPGNVAARYVIAAAVPPGYDQALPQLAASIYTYVEATY